MNIIKKCLDELAKEEFRKDYVIGLLESFFEMSGNTYKSVELSEKQTYEKVKDLVRVDEEAIPEFLNAGPLGNIKNI